MTPSEITIPLKSGAHIIRLPRGRIALVAVEVLGPKSARRLVETAAEMIGLAMVEGETSKGVGGVE